MFEHVLRLLPHQPGTIGLVLACIGSLAGLGFWAVGARFSRFMLTLAGVGIGTVIGMKLPRWCGWTVDPMGVAVGGAVILGVSSFALHRLWVGIWLGTVLTAWTALAVWTALAPAGEWIWPAVQAGQSLPQYVAALAQSLPDPLSLYLAWSCSVAMLAGIAAALFWPRIGVVLMWSAAGVSLAFGGVTMLGRLNPAVLRHLPPQTASQLVLVAGLVAAGAILQWQTVPKAKSEDAANGPSAAAAGKSAKTKHVD